MKLHEAHIAAKNLAIRINKGTVVYISMRDPIEYNYCSLRAWESQRQLTPSLQAIYNSHGERTHDYYA